VKPVAKIAKPAKSAKPAKAGQQQKAAKPAQKGGVKAAKGAKTGKAAKATKDAKAAKSAKAAKGVKAAKGAKAPKTDKKATPSKPSDKTKPTTIEKTSQAKKLTKKQALKKQSATGKALKAAKAIQKGKFTQTKKKVWTTVHFKRPKTLKLASKPKYARRSVPKSRGLDQYKILKHPLTTESAMKKIEDNNTLVFIVDQRANKHQIARAVTQMYQINAKSVNTLIRPDGEKKAFVRLSEDQDALDVANKIGII